MKQSFVSSSELDQRLRRKPSDTAPPIPQDLHEHIMQGVRTAQEKANPASRLVLSPIPEPKSDWRGLAAACLLFGIIALGVQQNLKTHDSPSPTLSSMQTPSPVAVALDPNTLDAAISTPMESEWNRLKGDVQAAGDFLSHLVLDRSPTQG